MTKAYSYLRFSTPEQAQGDSFRRQTDAARKYAAAHGLELDDSLTFNDLGVSAFRGKHATDGALSAFVAAVDDGKVRPGSYLLVEHLDRLSREQIMPALNRFHSLLSKGINIVTLADGCEYDKNSLNDLTGLIVPLVSMARANEESATKSKRGKEAWREKRRLAVTEGKPLTEQCPGWLRLIDGKYEPIPERMKVVNQIYDLALAGHGKTKIAFMLNEEKVPPFDGASKRVPTPDAWHASYIRKILTSEVVIGHFRPTITNEDGKRTRSDEPIKNYYPAVVDEEKFYRVRQMKGASGYKRRDLANILSGLVICHKCGGKMHFINKGPLPKGGQYFHCYNTRIKGTCDTKPVRYDVCLTAVLRCLTDQDLDLRSLLDNGHKNRKAELCMQLEALEGQISETEEHIENLLGVIERRPSDRVEKRLADNEATLEQLKQDKVVLEGDIAEASNGGDPVGDVSELIEKWSQDDLKGDLKVRLNAALKRIISTITIGRSDDAAHWIGQHSLGSLSSHKRRGRFALNLDRGAVSIEIRFKDSARLIVIAADPRQPDRLAAASAVLEGDKRSLVHLEEPVFKSSNFKLLNSIVRLW